MRKKLVIFAFLILFAFLFFIGWWNQAQKPPNPTENETVIFAISSGESARNIAKRLQEQNLIRSSVAFFLLARFTNLANEIQAGEFRLNPSMSLKSVTESLKHGTKDVVITIPEGWRNEEIALKIAQELSIPEQEILKLANEGYMFPDTYHFPTSATAQMVVETLSNNFKKKVSDEITDKASRKGLTLDNLITIASLVEREAKLVQDRPLVASVILNRLEINMKLDIDATIQYALGYQNKEKSWWKRNLTIEDLNLESPYNTYLNPGLPPTAICNPGIAAITAVIEAPDTEYLYYLSDNTGKTHFSNTIEEHNENITKYLN